MLADAAAASKHARLTCDVPPSLRVCLVVDVSFRSCSAAWWQLMSARSRVRFFITSARVARPTIFRDHTCAVVLLARRGVGSPPCSQRLILRRGLCAIANAFAIKAVSSQRCSISFRYVPIQESRRNARFNRRRRPRRNADGPFNRGRRSRN